MKNKPVGYSLTIRSYENDYDNIQNVTVDGLLPGDVLFYVYLLQHFMDPSDVTDETELFGNKEYDFEESSRLIGKAYSQYPPESAEVNKKVEDILCKYPDDAPKYISTLLGGFWDDYQRWRVFDSFTVHYIPQECKDVTDEFYSVFYTMLV